MQNSNEGKGTLLRVSTLKQQAGNEISRLALECGSKEGYLPLPTAASINALTCPSLSDGTSEGGSLTCWLR